MNHGRTLRVAVAALAVVAAASGVVAAQDEPIPIDSCRTIADDGRYVLTADVESTDRTVCIQILSGDVVFDGGGHTVKGANTTGSAGLKVNNSLTTVSNVTVENVSTTGWTAGVAYRDANNGTIRDVNASANRRYGVFLRAASDTRLRNVTAVDNARWSLYAADNTTNVTATNLTTRSANASFTAGNVALTGVGSPGTPPNRTTIGQYVGAASTGGNASLRLAVGYDDANVTSVNVTENTLRMWVYDGTWTRPPDGNFVNADRNRVFGSVPSLRNASVFAPAGETPTPTATPTPTPTATPTPTPTPEEASTPTATSADDGPGFSVALALVALLAAALFAVGRR